MALTMDRTGDGTAALMARVVDEVSLATWFGGAAMGALGLRRGADAAKGKRMAVESNGWASWQPVQTAAIASQVLSGAVLTLANRKRVARQRGVFATSLVRTAVLGGAMATTMMAARAGQEAEAGEGEAVDAGAEARLRRLQVATVALTGALVVLDAVMGEQQRPQHVARGVARRWMADAKSSASDRLPHPTMPDVHLPAVHIPDLHLAERLHLAS